ncbi:MAG TPA: histidine kinase [Ferruginibacter sp.]|nr:histidine kinase [Ferruginibacter sp.]
MSIRYRRFLLGLLWLPVYVTAQSTMFNPIDSARKEISRLQHNDTAYIQTCFFIAESFMEMNMYDSGQVWLNQISARLPLRKPSFFNFYLSVDQSETYYYNGLMMMHLQESQRMLRIATALKDSILLATANNFLGLAYMNVDSIRQSIPYFIDGIRYARQPPIPPQYLSASKPHHIYGNLAEAYYKLGMYDSARYNALTAKKYASEIPWPRGIAVANNMLGLIYAKNKQIDSAMPFQREAIDIGLASNQEDVSLVAYGALATCYLSKSLPDSARALLQQGFILLKQKPFINHFFEKQFLTDAISLYKKLGDHDALIAAMEMKMANDNRLFKHSDTQISTLVKGSVANETRAAKLETEEAKNKQALSNTRFIIALLALGSMIVLLILNRRYNKRQLKEMAIRNKISRDLHDDIGATLSSIQIYGQLADQVLEQKPERSREMIGKMTNQTKDLMLRMGDVIWSMKPVTNDQNNIETRIRNFGNELLAPKEITCTYVIDIQIDKILADPLARKNILLIIKEAMNNIAKYSSATEASVTIRERDKKLLLTVKDNGKGFEEDQHTAGNGIQNIQQRCTDLKGSFHLQTATGQGVQISCEFPLPIISHNEQV